MFNPSPDNTQPQSKTDFELEMLKQEYFFLQTTIEDYNKQIWVIKALGITGTGLVINQVLQQKPGEAGLTALIGCSIPIFFWILESQWKHFQRGFYPRVYEIEEIFKDRGLCYPGIFSKWSFAFKRNPMIKRNGYFWDGLFNPTVYISYVLEIIFLLLISFLK